MSRPTMCDWCGVHRTAWWTGNRCPDHVARPLTAYQFDRRYDGLARWERRLLGAQPAIKPSLHRPTKRGGGR